MKLRVVGWVYYDDDLEQGEIGWAARNAVIDEIKKRGYLFSGWAHQEADCCTPVLNDGKMYCFSQRGWGGVMAEAHGYTDIMDYARFAFMRDSDTEIRPKEIFDEETFTPEYDLNERFELQVTEKVFAAAQKSRKIKLDDLPQLRYLDKGDELALICGEKNAEYIVTDVERKKDLTEAQRQKLEFEFYDYGNPKAKRAEEIFNNTKIVMVIELKRKLSDVKRTTVK